MSALKLIKAARTLSDVAHLLGFQPKALAYLIRKMRPELRYTQFEIPKRSGGMRTISAPNKRLKLLQKRLAKHLQLCEIEIEAMHGVKRRLAHGFKPNCSILTNADVHRGRRYVFNIDLKDFFGTINFGRVRGFLIKNRDFALEPEAATAIAQIACHENALPQGSPCSPIISNLVANILDIRLAKLAKEHGCSYTRYADDITFSTSMKNFPTALAEQIPGNACAWLPGKALAHAIGSSGYSINHKKTRLQHRRSRQDVTGLTVNRILNAPVEYRRMLRAMVHRLCATGSYEIQKSELNNVGQTSVASKSGSLAQLEGMLNFTRQVELWRQRDDVPAPKELTASEKLLQQFLFYKEFAGAKRPAILFEGKTDAVYIGEALRRLAASFPALVDTSNAQPKLRLKLHRYSATAKKILELPGGAAPLKSFINKYQEKYRRITGPKGENPVVILLDNDAGANDILNLISGKKFGVVLVPGQQYFHVVDNLYVLLTTPVGVGAPHYIEQLFDDATLGKPISGKHFNANNEHNTVTEYGKVWFAVKVVKAESSSINFSGFVPLLAALTNLVSSHVAKVATKTTTVSPASSTVPLSAPIAVIPTPSAFVV